MEKGFKQLLLKTGIFLGFFMAFIFLIGTKLYQNDLLSGWKIEIWGRVGYILLFSIFGFILLYRERLLKLKTFKHKIKDYVFLIISFILLILFYLFEINATKFIINIPNIILVNLLGVSIFVFLWLGIYGVDFTKMLIKKFKRELFYFLCFGIVVAFSMNLIWSLWSYFSLIVTKIVYFLLKLVSDKVHLIEPRTLVINGFGAQIAEACSGVYSIFLFTALYLLIVFLDWKKINKLKAGLLFIPAVVGAFLVNILRVFAIMIFGAFVSKDIALGLYHSYVGMIFFLIYFALFWYLLYDWMKEKRK